MRSDAREAAFKIVFAGQFGGDCDARFQEKICKSAGLTADERLFAKRIVSLTEEHRGELIALLEEKVKGFAPERIYPVDRAVLLVALAEIKYMDDVPPVVSVNEATALARKYSTENSAGFVNGVLGGVINA